MRIPIREQLGLLVLTTSLMSLAVIAVVTWVNSYDFVLGIRSQGLALTASLKAAQLASDILLLQSTAGTITTRILIQSSLQRFYAGNRSHSNWVRAQSDLQMALSSGGQNSLLLQAIVFPKNQTGNTSGLLNVTGDLSIPLPYFHENGTQVMLGDKKFGYPPPLYPNITYTTLPIRNASGGGNITIVHAFPDTILNVSSCLLLGPLRVNASFALISLTLPIINNTSIGEILGFMTVVCEARMLYNVLTSHEGLGNTGMVLVVGPTTPQNLFPSDVRIATSTSVPANLSVLDHTPVQFVLPPQENIGENVRHASRMFSNGNAPFEMKEYPTVVDAFGRQNSAINNASSALSTTNEDGQAVSVGYAKPQTSLCDWVLLVEQSRSEAFNPIIHLRNTLLACVFGTAGGILVLVFPIAHLSVRPIHRLREATKKTVQPPGCPTDHASCQSSAAGHEETYAPGDEEAVLTEKDHKSILKRMASLGLRRTKKSSNRDADLIQHTFRVPGRVQDRKHFINDELTDLTKTFNEMNDELMMQYERLEERVKERTLELEISKKAAEAANESKTLFIANISHELKTPLNGILGMCAVCMSEDDLAKIKRSLGIVYKSGDLLLHLLNDLLTFSKNQIGQQLMLDEKDFRLSDISSQINTIFDKQVQESRIDFRVRFHGPESAATADGLVTEKANGPPGTGRLKDMCLWGDQHRILQVIINLVSNSLKFTPKGGMVEVRIRCVGEQESEREGSRKSSTMSKQNSTRLSRHRVRVGSVSNMSTASKVAHNASSEVPKHHENPLNLNAVNPKLAGATQAVVRERSSSPPPPGSRTLIFQFEVEDTGPGIPEHLRERVFEPFVQADPGLSKKHGGAGLGLSICSQLAKLMGGKIHLKSQVGVGSTFIMQIPLKFVKERADSVTSSSQHSRSMQNSRRNSASITSLTADEAPSVAAKATGEATQKIATNNTSAIGFEQDMKPRLVGLSQPFFASSPANSPSNGLEVTAKVDKNEKIRVLVVEDNMVNQEVVLRMLKLEDIYDVAVAKDGQEAFEVVKASMESGTPFNLIFMDIQMPNLDGLQSTRMIREMGYSAPIVALTAFAEESNKKECIDSGMNHFLAKPIRRPALKQVLKTYCATIPEEDLTSPEPTPDEEKGELGTSETTTPSPSTLP